ncbi:MAG: hypothetical protein ABSE75_03460 [Acidimicrobiales bacterium]
MRHHKKEDDSERATGPDPVDVFLAQAPFVEQNGVDEAAIQRDELLHGGPDAEAIGEAIRLKNLHHEQNR